MSDRSLAILFLCVLNSRAEDIPFAFVDVSTDNGNSYSVRFWAQAAAFGGYFPSADGIPYAAFLADDQFHFGCTNVSELPPLPTMPQLLVVGRGNCSFAEKAYIAQSAGADGVIVFDSIVGKYVTAALSLPDGSPPQVGSCDTDCSAGSFTVPAAVVGDLNQVYAGLPGPACTAACGIGAVCALPAPPSTGAPPDGRRQACCVPNDLLIMGAGSDDADLLTQLTIPLAYLSASDGSQLLTLMGYTQAASSAGPLPSAVVLRPALRSVPMFDTASILLWAVAVLVVGGAALISVTEERVRFRAACMGQDGDAAVAALPHHGVPVLIITPRDSYGALGMAAGLLLTLYLMVHFGVPIVYIIMTVFALGAWQSTAVVCMFPLLDRFAPGLEGKVAIDLGRFGYAPWEGVRISMAAIAAYVPSLILVSVWLAERHAPGAFVLQDLFGAALCATALSNVRIPNMRVCFTLLGLFFAYDIFMVFITPYIFGSSAMIDVATAGMPTPVANSACYCRLHPEDAAVCGQGEAMPILLRIPRIADWRGGDTMLGLGDIVIPGLAVSLAARRDWAPRGEAARAAVGTKAVYFPYMLGAYALGLALAQVAVVMTGAGQPALLYLCPCVCGMLWVLSRQYGESDEMWYGSAPGMVQSGDEDGVGDAGTGGAGGLYDELRPAVDSPNPGPHPPFTGSTEGFPTSHSQAQAQPLQTTVYDMPGSTRSNNSISSSGTSMGAREGTVGATAERTVAGASGASDPSGHPSWSAEAEIEADSKRERLL